MDRYLIIECDGSYDACDVMDWTASDFCYDCEENGFTDPEIIKEFNSLEDALKEIEKIEKFNGMIWHQGFETSIKLYAICKYKDVVIFSSDEKWTWGNITDHRAIDH